MSKIQHPQDQNGVNLINQTTLNALESDINGKIGSINKETARIDGNLKNIIGYDSDEDITDITPVLTQFAAVSNRIDNCLTIDTKIEVEVSAANISVSPKVVDGIQTIDSVDFSYNTKNGAKFFTYNAVVSDASIASVEYVSSNFNSGVSETIQCRINFKSIPTVTSTIYVIFDSICANDTNGTNSQHVTHILPVTVSITA
jgi:hypothetical protein